MEEQNAIQTMAQPDTSKGMTTKVMKGSFWVLMGQVLPLVATFVASPFVIRSLGSEAYGVLILMGLISTYFSFADFGMGITSTKYGSEAFGLKDYSKEGYIVRTALVISLISALLIITPLYIFADWVVSDFLNVPLKYQSQAIIGLRITLFSFLFNIIASVVNTPQLSRMRMDLNVIINSGFRILMTIVTPIVLYVGGNVVSAVLVSFFSSLLIMLTHIWVSWNLLPELFSKGISREMFKPLYKFGFQVVLYGIGLTLINNLEKVILTKIVSVQSLAFYSVASTFALMTTMFSSAIVQSLLPAFSQLMSPEKKNELAELYRKSSKLSFIVIIPVIMGLLVIAKPFFTLWAGPEFGKESIIPFYILLLGIFFAIAAYVPNCMILASGNPVVFSKFYLLQILPYGLITYVLISKFGIIGAAVAFSLRETFNSFYFIHMAKKVTRISFTVWSEFDKIFTSILFFVPSIVLTFVVHNFSFWQLFIFPCSLLLYSVYIWRLVLNTNEKSVVINFRDRTKLFRVFR